MLWCTCLQYSFRSAAHKINTSSCIYISLCTLTFLTQDLPSLRLLITSLIRGRINSWIPIRRRCERALLFWMSGMHGSVTLMSSLCEYPEWRVGRGTATAQAKAKSFKVNQPHGWLLASLCRVRRRRWTFWKAAPRGIEWSPAHLLHSSTAAVMGL